MAAVMTHAQLQAKLISLGADRIMAAAVVTAMDYTAVEKIVLKVGKRTLTITVDRATNLYGLGSTLIP